MEWGLLRDFFGNFSMRGERYYFRVEGGMQGGCKMRIATQGEKCLREVTFVGGGDNSTWGHVRWMRGENLPYKMTFVW